MADLKNIIINNTTYSGVKELSVRDADRSGVRDKFLSENFIEDYTPKITIVSNGSYTLGPTSGYVAAKGMGVNIQVSGGIEEIESTNGMDDALIPANIGRYYKYVGDTNIDYIQGDIYLVEAVPTHTLTFPENFVKGIVLNDLVNVQTSPRVFNSGDIIKITSGAEFKINGILCQNTQTLTLKDVDITITETQDLTANDFVVVINT